MTETITPLYLNFHDKVGVILEATPGFAEEYFSAEYQYHVAHELPEGIPKIIMRVTYSPDATRPDQSYTHHTHKLLARWSYQIGISPEEIYIDAIGNRFAISMIHHMLLHDSLRYLAIQQGLLMLHAGSITRNGKSFIFTGQGGTGKTTTTAFVLARGDQRWSLHADDYVFLSPRPQSSAYLTRSHLYKDLLSWAPELRSRISIFECSQLEIFGWLRYWSRERIKWAVRLPIAQLWPNRRIEMNAQPAGIFLLKRTNREIPLLTPVNPEEVPIEELVEMNFYEARHFIHLVGKSRAVDNFPDWLINWKNLEREALRSSLLKIPVYSLELPKRSKASAEAIGANIIEQLERLAER